jgi:hypothetical protein
MAHFAQINSDNKVINVVVVSDIDLESGIQLDIEELGVQYLKSLVGNDTNWVKTSYNTKRGIHYNPVTNKPNENQSKAFRKNYAQYGYTYDEQRDAFIPPKPYDSWILDEFSCLWESPIPYPNDGSMYEWNEDNQSWDLFTL